MRCLSSGEVITVKAHVYHIDDYLEDITETSQSSSDSDSGAVVHRHYIENANS